MKLRLLIALGLLPLAAPAHAEDYVLPGAANTVVLELSSGGLGETKLTPEVEILADGRVRLAGKAVETRLTKAQLQDLLRFVIDEQKFLDHDDEKIQRALEERPVGVCGTGARTTGVAIHLKVGKRSAKQLMLDTFAQVRPDIEMLTRLQAVARRLRLEGRLAQAGGRDLAEAWQTHANERLAKRHPEEAPFSLDDFQGLKDVPKPVGALEPGVDPNTAKIEGPCAHFVRHEQTPPRVLSAFVRVEGEPPVVAVSLWK